jgi:hypothetical protein
MVVQVVHGLSRCWPWTSSAKQVLMLNVLEEVLELAGAEACAPVLAPIAHLLARCVAASHFQVSERALQFWHNQALSAGLLGRAHAPLVLPALYAPLFMQAQGHWNPTVEALAAAVLKHYADADTETFERCAAGAGAAAAAAAAAAAPPAQPQGASAGAIANRAVALGKDEEARQARREQWRSIDAAFAPGGGGLGR